MGVGFLLCELLKDSEENREALEVAVADHQSLGSIALENKNPNLKLISGLIISHQVMFGSIRELYWPPEINKETLKEFPETTSEESQWLISFHSFMEKLESPDPKANVPPEPFALALMIDGDAISHRGGISISLEGLLTMLIPPSKGEPPQFVDIPFQNILNVETRPYRYVEVPTEVLPDPTDVVIHLCTHRNHTHHHNAIAKSAGIVVISFAGLSDAMEVAQYLKERKVKVSEGKRNDDPTLAFIGVVMGDRKPEKCGERWIGFNTGPFGDLDLRPSEKALVRLDSSDSEPGKQHSTQETIPSRAGSDFCGTNNRQDGKRSPDGVVTPMSHVNNICKVDPTDISEQGYTTINAKAPSGPIPNGSHAQSPLVPQPRRKLIHSMLRIGGRSAGASDTSADSGSDTKGSEAERNPTVGKQLPRKPAKKLLDRGGKLGAQSKGTVSKQDDSIYDLSQEEPPKPKLVPRKEAFAAKPLATKSPASKSKVLNQKVKRAKEVLAIQKGEEVLSNSQTDWDEGFGGTREDEAAQSPVKSMMSSKSNKQKHRKGHQGPLREANSSVTKPNGKPTKAVTTGKRKPILVIPQSLRSSRAAAVEATRKILSMDKDSENGSSANTQQGEEGEVSQICNETTTQAQLLFAKTVEPVALIDTDPGIRSNTNQSGPVLSVKKLPGKTGETTTQVASLTPTRMAEIGNRLRVQRNVATNGGSNSPGKPSYPMAGTQRRTPPGAERGAADVSTSSLPTNDVSFMPSEIELAGRTEDPDIPSGFEDIEHKHNTRIPDKSAARIRKVGGSTIASKFQSALAAIGDPPSDISVGNVDAAMPNIEKELGEASPKPPLRKRQRDMGLEENGGSEVQIASKKSKTGILSKMPKASAEIRAPNIDDTTCTRSPEGPEANPPSKAPLRAPITVLSLSSSSNDDGSYYSDSSTTSGHVAPANIQVSNEIRGARLAHNANETSVPKAAAKFKATVSYALHPQINITPKPRNRHDRVLVDDRLSSKPKIVGWSGDGPRNQGRIIKAGGSTARSGLHKQIHSPKQRLVRQTSPTAKELGPRKPEQQTAYVQEGQFPRSCHQRLPPQSPRKEKREKPPQNVPNALPSSIKTEQQISTLFVPRTNEDVVLNHDESHSPSIVEFSQKRSSQRARVEESGSPIPITKYYSEENEQDKNLRDAVTGNTSAKIANGLGEEFSLDGVFADEGQIANENHLTTSCETIFSSNRKYGPRSPWATSEIKFAGQEMVNIIRTARPAIDPFITLSPKKINSFMQKLQAKGVGEQVPAKRKHDEPAEATIKRIRKSTVQKGERTKGIIKVTNINVKQDPNVTLVNPDIEMELQLSTSGSTLYSRTSKGWSGSPRPADQRSPEKDPGQQWRESLKPHQSDMLGILYHISDDLIRHLVDKEICIEDIVHDYRRGGAKLIQELAQVYQEDYNAYQVALGKTTLAMRDLLTKTRRRIHRGVKQLKEKNMAAVKKDWSDRQKAQLGQLADATHLVSA
ncbi:MAG: hypothetical protein M1840_001068 [Geoglossum simile]|nr:MAG: hypothetical protein M1840_001068 [Geoglossum simile]